VHPSARSAGRQRTGGRGPAARLLPIAVPGGIEDYSHQINTASTHVERHRIGER
jgi:hypothetical protein